MATKEVPKMAKLYILLQVNGTEKSMCLLGIAALITMQLTCLLVAVTPYCNKEKMLIHCEHRC